MTNKENGYVHPYIEARSRLKEEQVIVLDNVTDLPHYDETLITDDLLIIICHRGWDHEETYDLHEKGVSVVMPKQIIRSHKSSEDFLQTIVAVSNDIFELFRLHYNYTHYTPYYRKKPVTQLTDEQYDSINKMVKVLRNLTQHESKYRSEMLINQLCIILNMIGEFRVKNNPEELAHTPQTIMFEKFYESITEHYHEAHEVAYYAQLFNLTPKYFASIIKTETGISANRWITDYVITKAKKLLETRKDLNLQQISIMLGFNEQASFSRYFKTNTGKTASEYRDGVN